MIFEKQIVNMYRAMAYNRCDDNGTAYYFSAADFEGLRSEPFEFTASAGHKLVGALYFYDGFDPGRLIVFDHGFGGGHLSYMKEIELLCRHGYRVLAYDHTGCMKSGGEGAGGMAQSLSDLNDCIGAVKSDPSLGGLDISVVGHSWGGFSTLNITALHEGISHIVVLSGFVSVELLVNSYFSGLLSPYRKPIMAIERESNPRFVNYSALDTLKNTEAKALLIYSDDDKMCRPVHYEILRSALSDKPNIAFRLERGKGHNPNYTRDGVKYLGEYISAKNRLTKKGRLNTQKEKAAFVASFDWNRMTAQDGDVWAEIFAFLDNNC
ncbi:MAG: alpha/beta fold hydrolase [Clostridia bacterium]|nr:alpha/beta fold hydrolase [Clostridia bacterium]